MGVLRPELGDWSARERAVGYAFVAGQFVLLGAVFAPVSRAGGPAGLARRAAGVALAGAGAAISLAGVRRLGRNLTAVPLPTRDAQLRTDGVYARVRHPIYAGLMLAALARAVATGRPGRLAAAGLLGGLLTAKASWEETRLRARFPGYAAYARRTPRFLPRPGGNRDAAGLS